MALSITQTPPLLSLAQSPIPITLSENGNAITSGSFQYVLDLYYWSGGINASASATEYTLVKYPNESQVGIFDVSRILNSTLTDLLEENPSNVKFFYADGYGEFLSGSVYVTGSHVRTDVFKYIDGYSIFQEPISQSIENKTPHWPLMTDGPATQSFLDSNGGRAGVYVGTYGNGLVATYIEYESVLGTFNYPLTSSLSSSGQIDDYPIGPNEFDFPFTASVDTFTVQAYNSIYPIGEPVRFNLVCAQKYPNIRIKWKNRYGQFDYFNFNMINTKQFNVSRQVYQPQIGSWGGANLSYEGYESNNLNYLVDTSETIQVNTDWVDEEYNEIFKQFLVSDEIYWVYDEDNEEVKPLTISTSNLTFKTGVVNKVIQYAFDLTFGQTYKLVI